MTRHLIALLLFCGLVTAASASSIDDSFIVSGHSIGPIPLGRTLAEIEATLGAPAKTYTDVHAYVWYPRRPSGPLMAVIGPDGKSSEVKTCWDVYYATPGGRLHVGMLEDDVRGILGRPLKTSQWSHFKVLGYRGISFTVDLNNVRIVTCVAVTPTPMLRADTPIGR
jgi:hypothetical protein